MEELEKFYDYLEEVYDTYFINLELKDNCITCFYETKHIFYKDIHNKDTSYLFPVKFKFTITKLLGVVSPLIKMANNRPLDLNNLYRY